jgi:2-polyprenyl-6-methoxyphenol hydroxylase-like FAD-dependent oxidoreductase
MHRDESIPRIGIVGGGPAGLTLARILHVHGIASVIFEREGYFGERPQGGSLDMHPDTGQFALRCAGLEPVFQRVARYEDQGVRIADKHGRILFDDHGNEGDRPEVDRAQLRRILLDSLSPGVVRWGHAPKSVAAQFDGTFELIFDNGAAPERFDLVVGADGAWSQIRPLVSSVQPEYEGILFVEFHLADVDTQHVEIAELVGHGKMFALGDCKGILAQRNANGHVYGCGAFRSPQTWLSNVGRELSSAAAKAKLTSVFERWSKNLLRFIYESDDRMIVRPLSFLPVGHSWENRPGVTLLGDAAHVMSPFSGEGANLAMRDAADLALGLADGAEWRAAVARFERAMFHRASVAAASALSALRDVFSEGGLAHALEQMGSHHPQAPVRLTGHA